MNTDICCRQQVMQFFAATVREQFATNKNVAAILVKH
jgi:hypothetical protein